MAFETKRIAAVPDAVAPDGANVHLLCASARASTAVFTLPMGAVSRAVVHRTVEEIWYVAAGRGRIWRQSGSLQEVTELSPGLSLTIPVGTRFQFRCDGPEALAIVAVTIPPWPGESEAQPVAGQWTQSPR